MKNITSRIFQIAAISAVTMAATQLQAASAPELTVAVPFDFIISGKALPAGNYKVVSVPTGSGISAFAVRNNSTKHAALIVMGGRAPEAASPATGAKVGFACRAGSCYWHTVAIPGRDTFVGSLPRISPGEQERMVALDARTIAAGR
ncbi:MAG: hypothetical protein IPJ98_09375 [Bryobacterales bacterium]|nr:hypothetical protein [Bryobacterales bacterium]